MTDNTVHIVEVGARDGLQNAPIVLSTSQKTAFLEKLLDLGFEDIEAGSFVRADRIPSMADTPAIADHFKEQNNRLWYLVPNLKGLESALSHGVTQLAFFTAASDDFNQKNIGMTSQKSVSVIRECVNQLKSLGHTFAPSFTDKSSKGLKLRLYISTVIGCPYSGKIAPDKTIALLDELMPLGFSQVSLGDTIGVGTPSAWKALLGRMDKSLLRDNKTALHCHDTYGTALASVMEGLNQGIRTFDASIGGLGGCPFAPGATGNLATEDLLYLL